MGNADRYDAESDFEGSPRRRRRHDVTCNGGQGPCDACEEEQSAADEVIYPVAAEEVAS